MNFNDFKKRLQDNFAQMTQDVVHLFSVNLDKEELWNLYLDSFPQGTNEIYKEKREYDCNCCKSFIRQIGNVVTIKNNQIKTIWDFDAGNSNFQTVIDAMDKYVKGFAVSNIWMSNWNNIGTDKNHSQSDDGKVETFEHFYIELPRKFVNNKRRSLGDIFGEFRDVRNVFKRSLDEFSISSIETVLELIGQGSLYKGEEWRNVLEKFLKFKKEYDKIADSSKELFAWEKSVTAGAVVGKIRNHSIGTLLIDISNGINLEEAVRKYEVIVAPTNYKRPKAIFTQKMLDEAKKTIEDLGYMEALQRRFAKIDDISVNNILFFNKNLAKNIKDFDVFESMKSDIVTNPKKFNKVEEISIDKFINDVLPSSKEVEIMVENKHMSNFVSLIASQNQDSKTMFKWNNNFGWSYKGNITDSMKERVKAAGGNINGVLRFSIQWNDGEKWHKDDLDAHCIEPNGNHIYFRTKKNFQTTGCLDVDIINPIKNTPAVENIIWTDKNAMLIGKYEFFVENYNNRGGQDGFSAEIEFDGQIYSFEYRKPIRTGEKVKVAEVILSKDGQFAVKPILDSNLSSKEVWGIKTNQFVPVSVVMFSPNYWNDQQGIGHKHYFFMLKDCINPETPNGFFNEFLNNDLEKHKRVFEALGSKMSVEESSEQLSGVGFSSTQRNDILVKVKGNIERVLKIKF